MKMARSMALAGLMAALPALAQAAELDGTQLGVA